MSRIAIFKLSHKITKQEVIGNCLLDGKVLNGPFYPVDFPEVIREAVATALEQEDYTDGIDYIGVENWQTIDCMESVLPDWAEAVFVPRAINQSSQASNILRTASDSYLTATIHQVVYGIWKTFKELASIPLPSMVTFDIQSWEDSPDVGYGFTSITYIDGDNRIIDFDRIASEYVQPTIEFEDLDIGIEDMDNESELESDAFEIFREKLSAIDIYENWDKLMNEDGIFIFSEELFQKIEAGE